MKRLAPTLILIAIIVVTSLTRASTTNDVLAAADSDCWNTATGPIYVPETGHHIDEPFLSVWRQYDLSIVGYPISEALEIDGMTVQYFERARFERHPEYAGTQYEVLLTQLGRWIATTQNDPAFVSLPADLNQPDPEAKYYPETGHYLQAPFRDYWENNGDLPVFGYPISEMLLENGLLVQYFERARFERHPENAGTPYEIELGHLGRQLADADSIDQTAVQQSPDTIANIGTPELRSYRIPALEYHRFGTPTSRYQVSFWAFEQQLIWLRDNGYTSVTISQVYGAIYGGGNLPDKPVMITIDDGFATHWEAAALLEQYGMRGVFFIVPNQGLTYDQIREMSERGHEIGSHTFKHPDLTLLSDSDLWHEISDSRYTLSEIIGKPVQYFAYPYGLWNDRVASTVAAAGYCGAVQAWGGKSWTPEARWNEPRIEVAGELSLAGFATLVERP